MHFLAFDVEEHFQMSAFDSPLRRRHWDHFESRIRRSTARLLDLLDEQHVRATFFVLGWVAERHPDLVRSIAKQGHEIASHGYDHELITAQTPKKFREDVRKTKRILEDLVGTEVLGYRAPSLVINEETNWALPILVEQGHYYDSSLPSFPPAGQESPEHRSLYYRLSTNAGPLWEVPPSNIKLAGIPLRIADSAYFRLLPYRMLRWAVARAEAGNRPLLLSLCAWEVDPNQPRMIGGSLSRFLQYVNLDKTTGRLRELLKDFRFGPIREAIPQIGGCRPDKLAG